MQMRLTVSLLNLFYCFSCIKGRKNLFLFETGKVAHELTEVKGIDKFLRMSKRNGKDIIEDIRLGCSEPQ